MSLKISERMYVVSLRWRQRWANWTRGSFRLSWNPWIPLNPSAKGVDALFLVAIMYKDLKSAKKLVQLGAHISVDDDLALDLAAAYGHADAVKYLLDSGADVHTRNESPLAWAVSLGHEKIRNLLLEHGADESRPSVRHAYAEASDPKTG